MSKKKIYWCGDDSFRGCVLRNIFINLGFQVFLPISPPNRSTGKLPKRGSMFRLSKIAQFLAEKGCTEISEIDSKWNVPGNGKGDIDFAVDLGYESAYVAEVKTRLIPRGIKYYGLENASLMLQYHLDEPNKAETAWRRLVSAGIVRPPKAHRRGDYDNPASIAELTRLITGFHLMQPRYRIILGVATLCYTKPLINNILQYVNNTYHYLKKCNIPVKELAIIIVYPDALHEIPSNVTVQCIGEGCQYLKLNIPYTARIPFRDCPRYHGCNDCIYKEICKKYCTE